MSRENALAFVRDGCDVVYHYYDTYICKRIDWCPGGYDL